MLRRQRRRQVAPPSNLGLAVAFAGLLILAVSWLVLDMTARTFAFWLSQGDYVRTELEITHLDSGPQAKSLSGIVAVTGQEVRVQRIPPELIEFDASGTSGTRMSPAKAKGLRVPIWYAESHTSFLQSPPVQYLSEYPQPPTNAEMLTQGAITLTMLTLGLGCAIWGFRTRQPEASTTSSPIPPESAEN